MGKEGIALIPVLDLLDHSPAAHVSWHTGALGNESFQFITYSGVKQAYGPCPFLHLLATLFLVICCATDCVADHHFIAFTQGDVVYSNYGYKSNEELIVGYGFVLDPNPADFFHISLGLGACSTGAEPGQRDRLCLMRALLHALGLPTTHYLTRGQPLPAGAAGRCSCVPPAGQPGLRAAILVQAIVSSSPASSCSWGTKANQQPAACWGCWSRRDGQHFGTRSDRGLRGS